MIDERFSAQAFSRCGLGTQDAGKLSDLLATEIYQEMHNVIAIKLGKIVQELNAMGHDLKLYEQSEPDEIAYRDNTEDETGYHCKLRVAIALIITVSYANLGINN